MSRGARVSEVKEVIFDELLKAIIFEEILRKAREFEPVAFALVRSVSEHDERKLALNFFARDGVARPQGEASEAIGLFFAVVLSRLPMIDEKEKLRRYELTKKVVFDQADDEGLWFHARTSPEAYLQQALRRLNAAIEGEDSLVVRLDPGD